MKDTEQSIIEAAILIFNEDLSAPLEKVAEQAQTTRRTLHRYFKDRSELMQRCKKEIQKTCALAMSKAYNSTEDPLKRLENMFYAGIECGSKNTFLHKLHTLHDHSHQPGSKECSEYEHAFQLWKGHLTFLRAQGLVSDQLTVDWMHHLFQGVVSAAVTTKTNHSTDAAEVSKLAWFSFSKGIGI